MSKVDDVFNDLMGNFFEEPEKMLDPQTPEQWLMERFTEGKNPIMFIIRFNLINNIKFRNFMRKHDGHITKPERVEGLIRHRPLSSAEFARIVHRDYVLRAHHAKIGFANHEGRDAKGKFDIEKFLDLLVAHPELSDCEEIAKKDD